MATVSPAEWIVLIEGEDAKFDRLLKMHPDTKLSEVLQMWAHECQLFGNWSFVSPIEGIDYEDDGQTLKMIGEVSPNTGIVHIKAKLSYELKSQQVDKIFVYLGDECHSVMVQEYDVFRDVLQRFPSRPLSFECNGLAIDLMKTVGHHGLRNSALFCESRHKINVRLSTGNTTTIEINANSLVFQLMDKIKIYENDHDFSLACRGRYLEPDEPVGQLNRIVEVSYAKFDVQLNGKHFCFQTRGQAMKFHEFLSQLSVKNQLDIQDLENMRFYCVGCQRCISKSDDDIQLLSINCCKEKSRTLIAKTPQETSIQPESVRNIEVFKRLQEDILRSAGFSKYTRNDWRKLKDRLKLEEGLNYNEVAKWSQEFHQLIRDLENKINTLEKWRILLCDSMKKLQEYLKASNEILMTRNGDLHQQQAKIFELETNTRTLQFTLESNTNILLEDYESNSKSLLDMNVDLEVQRAMNIDLENNIQRLQEDLDAYLNAYMSYILEVNKCTHSKLGMKLLVKFNTNFFVPIVPRPELQSGGKYSYSNLSFIKCELEGLCAGWTSFRTLRKLLKPLFTGRAITTIRQWRGTFGNKEVAEVTALTDDREKGNIKLTPFCSEDGHESSWKDVKREWQWVSKGGWIFLCGGRRRTVLRIFPF